jgi:hypothetical protein
MLRRRTHPIAHRRRQKNLRDEIALSVLIKMTIWTRVKKTPVPRGMAIVSLRADDKFVCLGLAVASLFRTN